MIDYKNMRDLRFAGIKFEKIETSEIGEVISKGYNDFFKREDYNKEAFKKSLFCLLQADPESDCHCRLVLPRREDASKYFVFLFNDDFQITAFDLRPSEDLDNWMTALVGDFENDKPLMLSFSKSSANAGMVEIKPLFEKPETFFQTIAPRNYHRDREKAERELFLSEFKVLPSMKQEINLGETKDLWQAFLNKHDANKRALVETRSINLKRQLATHFLKNCKPSTR